MAKLEMITFNTSFNDDTLIAYSVFDKIYAKINKTVNSVARVVMLAPYN